VRSLGARRTTLRAGTGEVELLEPAGSGPVADFAATAKGGLFAAGVATPDLPSLRAHLERQGITAVEEGGQLFVPPESLGLPGLRLVISEAVDRPAAGLLRFLYEVTYLTADAARDTARFAQVFALDAANFAPIRSEEFGYDGTLALFGPDRLDRLEIITPFDPIKTMGRFFARRGPSLYMCYGEADDLGAVRARLLEHAPHDWTGPAAPAVPDNLFIHPRALSGMMVGVSRTTFAWIWSGRPERVEPR
jgi:hypothetical protein